MRFQPSYGYGKFEMTPEATEGLVSIVSAGAGLASKAISAKQEKKAARARSREAKAQAALDLKKKALEAKIAEAQARAAAATAPVVQKAESVPGWAIGVAAVTVLGIGGFLVWRSRRPAGAA